MSVTQMSASTTRIVSDIAQPINMTLLPPFLFMASLIASGALSRWISASAVSKVKFACRQGPVLCKHSLQGKSQSGSELKLSCLAGMHCLNAIVKHTPSKELTWLGGPDGPICHVVHHLHEPDWLLAELLDTKTAGCLRPCSSLPGDISCLLSINPRCC